MNHKKERKSLTESFGRKGKAMRLIGSLIGVLCIFAILAQPVFARDVYVRGHYRSNGTYVQPHYRSAPDGNFFNNWSTKPNINPYTGKRGTLHTPRSYNNYSFPKYGKNPWKVR